MYSQECGTFVLFFLLLPQSGSRPGKDEAVMLQRPEREGVVQGVVLQNLTMIFLKAFVGSFVDRLASWSSVSSLSRPSFSSLASEKPSVHSSLSSNSS